MNENKVALVTGAARGIGKAIAGTLLSRGYDVVAIDVVSPDAKDGIRFIRADITSNEDRKMVIDEIDNIYGRLDVLVNNAGVAPKKRMDILETSEESMDFVLGINLKGTFFMSQQAAVYMLRSVKKNDGAKPVMINISSISADTSSVSRSEYCISKAGVSMITTLFADRLAEHGINVYEIRPGIIFTDMTEPVKEKYDRLIENGLVPFKRWGLPEDIAKAVAALCSGDFAFTTGEVIHVDGGFHIRRL